MSKKKTFTILFSLAAIIYVLVLLPNMFSDEVSYFKESSINTTNRSRFGDLCVIARSYPNSESYLTTLLLSLSHNEKIPQILVIATEPFSEDVLEKYNKHINMANQIAGINFAQTLHIFNLSVTDYGYAFTDAALDYLLEHQDDFKCSYVLFTNGDNFYSKGFLDAYLDKDMSLGFDMIGFNFISHHRGHVGYVRKHKGSTYTEYKIDKLNSTSIAHLSSFDGTNFPKNTEFQVSEIDLGACLFKISIFKENPELRFTTVARDIFTADGQLIVEFYKKSNNTILHREYLFVHQ